MSVWGQILDAYVRTTPVCTGIVVATDTKVCTRCGERKKKSEFYPRPTRGPEEVTSACRRCLLDANASTKRNHRKKGRT